MKNFPYTDIINYCTEKAPQEACGLVVLFKGRYRWLPCENVSSSPLEEFAIAPLSFANAEDMGDIVAIVHSHPSSSSSPSGADIASQKVHGIPWLIVGLKGAVPNELFWLKGEKYLAPLYQREYIWHVYDCGSFIKDFYEQEFNILLPDYYREDKFWEKGIEPYLDVYEKLGFYEVEKRDIQYGDVALMQIGSNICTHAAIYVDNSKIAHHVSGRLSCREPYGQYYQDRTVKLVRHKDINIA